MVKKWVSELDEEGMAPEMVLLRWADKDELRHEEQKALDRLFQEHELFNVQTESRYSIPTSKTSPGSRFYTNAMIELLDWFDSQPCSCATIARMADNIDRSRQTVRRKLAKLIEEGHAELLFESTGEYRLISDPRDDRD
jgi:response regulator of citrate/malate metabolism